MFEKEIKAIEQLSRGSENAEPWKVEALAAAIELFRAAQPKNEAVEREHCEVVARHLGTQRCLGVNVATVVASERAAVRAECLVRLEKACRAHDAERAALTVRLMNAEAELAMAVAKGGK